MGGRVAHSGPGGHSAVARGHFHSPRPLIRELVSAERGLHTTQHGCMLLPLFDQLATQQFPSGTPVPLPLLLSNDWEFPGSVQRDMQGCLSGGSHYCVVCSCLGGGAGDVIVRFH